MDINSIMFDNIGSKIKGVAKAVAWINIILSVIAGIILFFASFVNFKSLWYFIFLSPVVIVVGCFMAWLSVIALYGFGELIEANCNNEKNTRSIVKLLQQNGAEKSTNYTAYNTVANTAANTVYNITPQAAPVQTAAIPNAPVSDGVKETAKELGSKKAQWVDAEQKYGVAFGKCENCGAKNQRLIFAETTDFFGTTQKNICFECFWKKDSKAIPRG